MICIIEAVKKFYDKSLPNRVIFDDILPFKHMQMKFSYSHANHKS